VTDFRDALRKLTIRDDAFVQRLLVNDPAEDEASHLDDKTHALVRVGALVVLDAATPSYIEAIGCAQRAGASSDEIVGCLLAVLPAAGLARVVSAAPKVALGLGYDVDEAFETS
jgi:alkylhydroperoxidase/carboxymuconolactone decarboxylase family protein YurZ